MKKVFLALLAPLAIFLTSCDAHFGSKHFYLPWWAVALIIIASTGISFVLVGNEISKSEYRCKKCGKTFYPTRTQGAFSLHDGDDRVFKCPHCGHKGFCTKTHNY